MPPGQSSTEHATLEGGPADGMHLGLLTTIAKTVYWPAEDDPDATPYDLVTNEWGVAERYTFGRVRYRVS